LILVGLVQIRIGNTDPITDRGEQKLPTKKRKKIKKLFWFEVLDVLIGGLWDFPCSLDVLLWRPRNEKN
jgi:hypothetical protein